MSSNPNHAVVCYALGTGNASEENLSGSSYAGKVSNNRRGVKKSGMGTDQRTNPPPAQTLCLAVMTLALCGCCGCGVDFVLCLHHSPIKTVSGVVVPCKEDLK